MILFGVRAHDYGRREPEDLFSRIAADGFASVQLAPKKALAGVCSPKDMTPERQNRVERSLGENHLSVSVFGAYYEIALTEEKQRRKNSAEFIENIPIAARLQSGCVGTETTAIEKQPGVTRKEATDALLRSLWEIMPVAEENRIAVAIEPTFPHTVNTPQYAAEILKTVQSPWLRVIFDPVNLLSPSQVREQDQLWNCFFELLGEKISAVHIKGRALDGKGGLKDSPLEESIIHYRGIFHQLKSLPQDFGILREEFDPSQAKQDLKFLKSVLETE